eukprot:CAMPEP_0168610372 /NCGR_PEP_ID=MMETSP0449_2-20121227/1748_1 /TAXON_ID=1082188 /ORGANISM="Strombidium rassoulzadegani, Strain ras09" /LENGTH=33 /DNA_ID= /DNA_START= /DNA_END= /DNA_ORIENTATION=
MGAFGQEDEEDISNGGFGASQRKFKSIKDYLKN